MAAARARRAAEALASRAMEHETHHGAAEQSDLVDDRPPGELLVECREEFSNAVVAQHVQARSRKLARTNTLRERKGAGLSASADALRLS